jgi:putative FmdB family regulatory protein
MPLYEYRCRSCDERFEVLQRVGEGAETAVCPACGGHEIDKQLSTFATAAPATGASAQEFSSCAPGGCCGGGACGLGDFN